MMANHSVLAGDEDLTGPETIQARWPYDGPHSREQVSEAADALYSLVRYLNNATNSAHEPTTLGCAVTSYRVAGGVKAAVSAMDQLLGQLGDALQHQATNPTLHDDRRDRPAGDTAHAAAAALRGAQAALGPLLGHLDAATSAAGHLGNDN